MTKTSAVFPQPAAGVKPTPRVYTEEQKTMIEELRQYALSLLLPETDPYHPNERRWIEEPECPARYMRAAKWKLEDGKRRIKGTIEWRREYKPDLISAEHVKIENDSGKILLNGFDYDGRPIITMRVGRQNTQPSERQILHLIFCLERAIDYMPEGQDSMLILVDYKSATLKSNPSISTALKVLHILQDHYVERLGRAIVTNLPMLLNFFFKGIGPFLDPVTREKMKFNPNLHELIPDEHLEVEFGGKFDYEFNPDSYWEQICRHSGVNADGSRYEPEWKRAQKEQEESPKPVDSETSSTAPDLVADDDDVESSRAPSVQLPRASKPLSVKGGSSGKDGVEVIGEEEPNVLVADLVGVDGEILPATSETPDWLSFRLGGSPQLQPATTAPTLSSSLPLTSPPVPPILTVQLMSHFSVPPSPPASASSKYTYDSSTTGTATGSHSNHNQHHSLILRRGSPSNQNQHIMHPALLISEIIHSVFSNFTIPGDRATLINLACTCQAFYDIALDYLWKEIRGVTCFSRMLFPEPLNDELDYDGAWRSRTERFQAVRTERERLISLGLDEKQRTRVMSCARRVRRIAMGDKDMDDPETYTFFAFVAAYPPQPDPTYQDANMSVLPNLRHLHSTVRSIHGITHTIHLLQLTSNKLWDWNGSNNNSGTSNNEATAPAGNESEITPESESGPSQPRPPLPSRSSSTSTLQHTSSLRTLQVSAFVPWTYQTSSQMLVNERYMELARSGAMLTRLQRLEFRVDQVSAAIEIAFADAVVNLKSIRYIDLGLKKHAIGRAIANMAGKLELKDVRLSFSKEDVPGALEPHPSGTFEELFEEAGLMPVKTFADAQSYPVLENLHLSASADCIVDTLRFFDLPSSLRHLQIHPTALSLDDLTFLLEVISTNPSHLKTCVLSDTRLWMNKRTVGAVPPFTMRPMYPLLILTQLEIVKIDLDIVYHLTDDDLGDMASAWPNLQVLHICPWKEVEAVSVTTLPSFVGLRTLTAGCPNLLELKLKIDASRNVGDVIKSLGKSARARSAELRKWFIGASAIQEEQAETVAEAIHLLFPKLEALGLPREVVGNPAKYEEWTKVHDALRALQPIREDPYLRL